jgi:hypothetical protein
MITVVRLFEDSVDFNVISKAYREAVLGVYTIPKALNNTQSFAEH